MKTFGMSLSLVLVLLTAACVSTIPVYNVANQAVVTVAGKPLVLEDVSKAIFRAGGTLGWSMKQIEPGYIVGTLKLREHIAIVDIRYTAQAYSINYKDSTNLKYDGANIHGNYNGWIRNLNNAIKTQLLVL